jgi:hypothetical protein
MSAMSSDSSEGETTSEGGVGRLSRLGPRQLERPRVKRTAKAEESDDGPLSWHVEHVILLGAEDARLQVLKLTSINYKIFIAK